MAGQRAALRTELRVSTMVELWLLVSHQGNALLLIRFYFFPKIMLSSNLGGCQWHGFPLCSCLKSLAIPRSPKSVVHSECSLGPSQGHSQGLG